MRRSASIATPKPITAPNPIFLDKKRRQQQNIIILTTTQFPMPRLRLERIIAKRGGEHPSLLFRVLSRGIMDIAYETSSKIVVANDDARGNSHG
mmetsp:Transcript_16194/g.27648  ORF Transcript_16194/g.27648 Transcript_16194/m.27648 type:complete len:94 (+) Transcript_16194:150-431(+)